MSEGTAAQKPAPDRSGELFGDRPVGVERRRRPDHIDWRLAVTLAIGLAGGALLFQLIEATVVRLQGLLLTLLLSLFLSFAMEPAVQWMAQRGVRRGLGTMLVFLAGFLLLAGFVAAMWPLVFEQVSNLVNQAPTLLTNLSDQAGRVLPGELGDSVAGWLREQSESLPSRVPDLAGTIGRGVLGVGTTLLAGIVQLLTTLLVTFYLVADGPRLRRTLSQRLEPSRQKEFLTIWELAIGKTGGYVYSRILTAVVSAIFHIVVFTLIGVPYPAALGMWVGLISSLIPVIGTYLAGALPLLIALASSPFDAVWVLVAIVVYQQIENYLVAPRITAATMALHPAVAFVSVLIGGAMLGPIGALLALPAAAIVAALFSAYGERHEVMTHGLTAEDREPRTGSSSA